MNFKLKKITAVFILAGFSLWIAATITAVPDLAPDPAPATTPDPAASKKTEKKAEMPGFEVNAKEVKLPGITIDRITREVRIDAEVCLESGMLEYVVCRPDTFDHESIFTTTAKPELVHAALLLCGLKPTLQLRGMTDLWTEKALKQPESRLTIEVEWEEKGVKKRVNLTSLLIDRENDDAGVETTPQKQKDKKSLVQDAWIFAGSFLHVHPKTKKEFYAANSSGILVGIWPNPTTVIQYGVSSGNPYEGRHLGLEVNEKIVPKLGTKVKLVFSQFEAPIKKSEPKK